MIKLNIRQLRKLLLQETAILSEALPGEVTNMPKALAKLLDVYEKKKGVPPQFGGFPAILSMLMDELNFSDSEQKQVSGAYYSK